MAAFNLNPSRKTGVAAILYQDMCHIFKPNQFYCYFFTLAGPTSYGSITTPTSSSTGHMSEVDLRSEADIETHRQIVDWEDTGSTCKQKLRFFYNGGL